MINYTQLQHAISGQEAVAVSLIFGLIFDLTIRFRFGFWYWLKSEFSVILRCTHSKIPRVSRPSSG